MSDDTASFDPTGETERHIGRGMFEEGMGPGSSMAHLYRGEVHRMKFWRERLDRTTNWAITIMAAILTWAFTGNNPHYIVLIGLAMLTVFLVIEARRYRGYDLWRSRVRLMQENVFANALDASKDVSDPHWRRELSEDYRQPKIKISFEEALAHRLRRVYLPLMTVLLVAWLVRITAFTQAAEWPASAAIGAIPGIIVSGVVVAFFVVVTMIACRPRTWRANGELRLTDVDVWGNAEQ
ncbi:hypothetical protein C448_05693 [Halococcus morrhuae DSM 1307]|uniref:DUF2270 domain-containing protein n=1 Tax=Halococcus morrhuae DSM 1307 TaxID=931277 RepID=M0MQV6_HALMO|nr:DUF2270 domain-containing protein [Halococcus morrhuae]EMA46860.1 hypothetical protein C448_05693 [Halococcus morrhuae DSM 1307]